MIKLNENYSVDVTPKNYTLLRYRGQNSKGADRWETVGYYNGLRQAIRACITDTNRRKLSEGDHTLREALEILKQSEETLADMLRKAGIEND